MGAGQGAHQLLVRHQRVARVDQVPHLLEVRLVAAVLTGQEHRQVLALVDGAVDADLRAGRVPLDHGARAVGPRIDLARGQGDPERRFHLGRVGREHDPDARPHRPGLDHHRIADPVGRRPGLLDRGGQLEARLVEARRGEFGPGAPLVAAAAYARYRQTRHAELGGEQSGVQDERLVPAHQAGDAAPGGHFPGRRPHRLGVEHVGDDDLVEVVTLPRGPQIVEQHHVQTRRPGAAADRRDQVLPVHLQAAADDQQRAPAGAHRALLVSVVARRARRSVRMSWERWARTLMRESAMPWVSSLTPWR